MSNINCIILPKKVTADELDSDLRALLGKRFNHHASIDGDAWTGYWNVNVADYGAHVGINYVHGRKITFKAGGLFLSGWLEGLVRSSLGKKYKGYCRCVDDDIGKWEPEPKRFADPLVWAKSISKEQLAEVEAVYKLPYWIMRPPRCKKGCVRCVQDKPYCHCQACGKTGLMLTEEGYCYICEKEN